MLRKIANNRIFQSVSTVCEIIITITLLVLIILTGFQRFSNQGSFFGYRIFTVASGSMIPMYNIGDTLLVKDVPIEEIEIGDAVTYQSVISNRKVNITHEVIDIEFDELGKRNFHTKGIANNIEDPIVGEEQVVGKVTHKFFFLSILGYVTTNKLLLLLFITIPLAVLVAIEIIKIIYRDEENAREEKKERKILLKKLKEDSKILSEDERQKKIEAIRNGQTFKEKNDKHHLSEEEIHKKIEAIKSGKNTVKAEESDKKLSDIMMNKDTEEINFESISDISTEESTPNEIMTEEEKDEITAQIKALYSRNDSEPEEKVNEEIVEEEKISEKNSSEDEFLNKLKELKDTYNNGQNSNTETDMNDFLKYVKDKLSEDNNHQDEK